MADDAEKVADVFDPSFVTGPTSKLEVLCGMRYTISHAFVRYHRGLGKMPRSWKPWLISLLAANMIIPLFFLDRIEAVVVFGTALVNGAIFVVLTAYSGFSRLLGWGHLPWIPLILYLVTRLSQCPADDFYGIWIRAVIGLNTGCLFLDGWNVVQWMRGDREELVAGLDGTASDSSDTGK